MSRPPMTPGGPLGGKIPLLILVLLPVRLTRQPPSNSVSHGRGAKRQIGQIWPQDTSDGERWRRMERDRREWSERNFESERRRFVRSLPGAPAFSQSSGTATSRLRGGRRSVVVWIELRCAVSACRRVCRQDCQRGPACRPSCRAADRVQLVINLKTPKVLSLTIPQSVLLRADEVIQ